MAKNDMIDRIAREQARYAEEAAEQTALQAAMQQVDVIEEEENFHGTEYDESADVEATEEELQKLTDDIVRRAEGNAQLENERHIVAADTLTQSRGATHGKFDDHARITQRFKMVMHDELNGRHMRGQTPLTFTQQEAIEMILHKIGRVIAGDASFADHWDDIGGYAHIANGAR